MNASDDSTRDYSDYPDYPMKPVVELTTPEQFSALGDPLRQGILALLSDRAATTRELAATLESPTSTVAHHLRVLQSAGLIHVVRTRQARAMTERYYGRTARTFVSVTRDFQQPERDDVGLTHLRRALTELERDLAHETPSTPGERFQRYLFAQARLTPDQIEAVARKLDELSSDFERQSSPDGVIVSLVSVLYRAGQPELPHEK
jgi:DNA-binding transcriptional ArsR family regulator